MASNEGTRQYLLEAARKGTRVLSLPLNTYPTMHAMVEEGVLRIETTQGVTREIKTLRLAKD